MSRVWPILCCVLLLAAWSQPPACGTDECPHGARGPGCHSEPAAPSLSPCCGAPTPLATHGAETGSAPAPAAFAVEAPPLPSPPPAVGRGHAPAKSRRPLFELHRSLLL